MSNKVRFEEALPFGCVREGEPNLQCLRPSPNIFSKVSVSSVSRGQAPYSGKCCQLFPIQSIPDLYFLMEYATLK